MLKKKKKDISLPKNKETQREKTVTIKTRKKTDSLVIVKEIVYHASEEIL